MSHSKNIFIYYKKKISKFYINLFSFQRWLIAFYDCILCYPIYFSKIIIWNYCLSSLLYHISLVSLYTFYHYFLPSNISRTSWRTALKRQRLLGVNYGEFAERKSTSLFSSLQRQTGHFRPNSVLPRPVPLTVSAFNTAG